MDKHERKPKLCTTGYNSELEKFKRRLIRAVARMLLHEKRNENEVWEGLKKETGCDCQELWNRMHALTLKKLNRLLEAQDRVDLLPKAARMSLTDWLLFDTVIVHEDFDVIGMPFTTKTDRSILVDLFDLVERFKIEFLAGDELAEGWSRLTIMYNKNNRQCSPMLLQRRWYQLKLATRTRFYTFWSKYKGVIKKLNLAEPYKPTPLQIEIAKKYKPLVVKPFMMWDDLVKNKLVILPEEFGPSQLRKRSKSNENSPDVLCVEPAVETIDLNEDSDTEIEYRKPEEDRKEEPAAIKIKEEPKDIDDVSADEDEYVYENRQEKMSNFAEAAMEATALELDEIELDEEVTEVIDSKSVDNDAVLLSDDITEIAEENHTSETEELSFNINNTNDNASSTLISNIEKQKDIDSSIDNNEVDSSNVSITNEPEQMLPQITSIFGGVDVSTETLSKISMLTAQITNKANKVVIDSNANKEVETPSDAIVESDSDCKINEPDCIAIDDDDDDDAVNKASDDDSKADIIPDVNKTWFGELSNDIDFADDGIQLMDDGIACQDEEYEYKIGVIKSEIDIEEHEVTLIKENNEEPKVDKKLLMMPIVSTVKLDDMGILPIELLEHLDNKELIEIIHFKSKPFQINVNDDPSEPEKEEKTTEIKKVKLSSALLQKPRIRTYTPIQLCKNPDFNTRLKRLPVGFFGSPRNILLLKGCNPVTIDVAKTFEHRLVEGTLYLNTNNDENSSKNLDFKDNSLVSVVPSAMPVQSLIDNTKEHVTHPQLSNVAPLPCERNTVINLPDISEIRRINQKLLTAEVTPLQLKKRNVPVPVTIIPNSNDYDYYNKGTKAVGRHGAGPKSRKKRIPTKVLEITKEGVVNYSPNTDSQTKKAREPWRTNEKVIPWKPRQMKLDIPWGTNSSTIYDADTLLALDTLNKMLYLLADENRDNVLDETMVIRIKKQKKRKKKSGTNDVSDNDDVEVVSETRLNVVNGVKVRKSKTNSFIQGFIPVTYCCWAREKLSILNKVLVKRVPKHNCAFPLCLCCCKNDLADYYRDKTKEAAMNITLTLSPTIDLPSSISEDIAEIIPIVEKPAETTSSLPDEASKQTATINKTLINKGVQIYDKETSQNKGFNSDSTSKAQDINSDSVMRSDIGNTTKGSSINQSEIAAAISTINKIDVGKEVSIVSSENSESKSSATCTKINTNCLKYSAKKPPRFRISTSFTNTPIKRPRQQCIEEQINPHNEIKDTTAPRKKIVIIDHIKKPEVPAVGVEPSNMKLQTNVLPKSIMAITDPTKPKVALKPVVNQRMIYINSKKISDLPSENPIYLGSNKILLTTAKFPPNFKAFEKLQHNLKQTFALPKGIQLILEPSGRLTYIRSRLHKISDDFMATMPHLIGAFQFQIDSCTPAMKPGVTQHLQNEVINLSDDENTEESENNKIANNETNAIDKTNTNNLSSESTQQSSVVCIQNINLDLQQLQDDHSNTKANHNLEATQHSNMKVVESNDQDGLKTYNITNNTDPENEIPAAEESVHTPDEDTKEATEETNQTLVTETPDHNAHNESNINNSGKTKNILSDLMAMSGIESIDMSPTTQEIPPLVMIKKIITPEDTSVAEKPAEPDSSALRQILIEPQASPTTSQLDPQTPTSEETDNTKNLLLHALTAITSLSELKYACSQNGTFYKLDLATGLLVPINVCMKKLTGAGGGDRVRKYSKSVATTTSTPAGPKPVIDLTDDDVCELIDEGVQSDSTDRSYFSLTSQDGQDISNTSTDNASEPHNKVITENVHNKETTDSGDNKETTDSGHNNETTDCNAKEKSNKTVVKPLKLFRSKMSRPIILERKLKEIQKRISQAMTAQDIIRRKLKRKQEMKTRIEETMDVNSKNRSGDNQTEDSSSDEEPLSLVAKKKRAMENKDTGEDNSVAEYSSKQIDKTVDTGVDTNVKPIESNGVGTFDEFADDPDFAEDEIEMEYLDEEALDADEGNDCILGV